MFSHSSEDPPVPFVISAAIGLCTEGWWQHKGVLPELFPRTLRWFADDQ